VIAAATQSAPSFERAAPVTPRAALLGSWRVDPWSARWSLRRGTRSRCRELVSGGFRAWVGPVDGGRWGWTLQVAPSEPGVPSWRWRVVSSGECRTRTLAKRVAQARLEEAVAYQARRAA
jgi:hypothetical protein